MSDPESRWISPCDVLIAMARAYSAAMQVDSAEARERSQVTIIRYLSAGYWPARAGAYHCELRLSEGGGRQLAKTRNDENDEWVIPKQYWQIVEKSGAHLNANWYLGEFDLPPYHEATGTFSGFARQVEFDRTYLSRLWHPSDDGVADQTGDAGRPELGATLYLRELQRRIQDRLLEPSLAAQAEALQAWYHTQYPDRQMPKLGTVKSRIRASYHEAMNPTK